MVDRRPRLVRVHPLHATEMYRKTDLINVEVPYRTFRPEATEEYVGDYNHRNTLL
jgi:hypothetical protein